MCKTPPAHISCEPMAEPSGDVAVPSSPSSAVEEPAGDAAVPVCPSSPVAAEASGNAEAPKSSSSSSSSSSSVEYVPAAPKKRARNEPKPRRLYHIVFSCPKPENRETMRTPESVGKEAFGKLIEEKLETLRQGRNKLLGLSCFEEIHHSERSIFIAHWWQMSLSCQVRSTEL